MNRKRITLAAVTTVLFLQGAFFAPFIVSAGVYSTRVFLPIWTVQGSWHDAKAASGPVYLDTTMALIELLILIALAGIVIFQPFSKGQKHL